jgi:hypothetical protein
MKSCLLGVVCAVLLSPAQAVVFDCVADQALASDGKDFSVVKVRQRKRYTIDTANGTLSDDVRAWGYQVLQQGDAKAKQDWVLLYLPEAVGAYNPADDVLRQLPFSGFFRIRVWKEGNPFLHNWGGVLELGSCKSRRAQGGTGQGSGFGP